jgi:hypothetical protein
LNEDKLNMQSITSGLFTSMNATSWNLKNLFRKANHFTHRKSLSIHKALSDETIIFFPSQIKRLT